MGFEIEITDRAQAEFERQFDYLLERSPQGADAWATEFQNAANSLADNPERFGFAPENADHSNEIRQVMFKTRKGNPYRLLYTVRHKVFVLSLRGLGQGDVNF